MAGRTVEHAGARGPHPHLPLSARNAEWSEVKCCFLEWWRQRSAGTKCERGNNAVSVALPLTISGPRLPEGTRTVTSRTGSTPDVESGCPNEHTQRHRSLRRHQTGQQQHDAGAEIRDGGPRNPAP